MTNKISVWQQSLAQAFNNIETLCQFLQLNQDELPISVELKAFPLRVPRHYAELMEKGNANDPLLRQVLPVTAEQQQLADYSNDPVGDLPAVVCEGVIHKYHGRVLLIVTGACAIHCRYCFRRNFPYAEQQLNSQKLDTALSYIQTHSDISEVILSGGDPLLLNDDKLARLLSHIANIEHVQRIRIHSRLPIVLPERISTDLLKVFADCQKQLIVVTHANHSQELSAQVAAACRSLTQSGIMLLNQAVLLKGVNDNADSLCQLSVKLCQLNIMPYYLHLLDRAHGTGHFAVSELEAKQLIKTLKERLPGYLVPKLVTEQPGSKHKTAISDQV